MKIWVALVALRFVLVLIPQTGYVHPDEFFQSPEVVAGDVLNTTVARPWEFNRAFPIRTITIPYVTVGISLALTQTSNGREVFGSPTHPYWLLVLPRLVMALLSLIQDYCLYRLCAAFKVNHERCLCVFALSWVCLVFYTRTLGNTVEACLVSCLLWKVGMIIHSYGKKTGNRESKKHKSGKHVVQDQNMVPNIPGSDIIGTFLILGIFNRPTFLCYAFIPLLFWLKTGLKWHINSIFVIMKRLCRLLPSCLLIGSLLIAVDTLYYHNVTIADLISREVSMWELIKNVVITPANFIRYNLNSSNLASHGLHPRWLHILVNMPLLFSVLGIYGLSHYAGITQDLLSGKWFQNQQLQRPVNMMMFLAFIFPLVSFSLVPHQEPRFLAPLLFPLVFLYAPSLASTKKARRILFVVWMLHNIICAIFYGFLHQGGLIPCLFTLNTKVQSIRPPINMMHIVFSHTYMPPRFLLGIKNANSQVQVFVSDFGGQDRDILEAKVKDILTYNATTTEMYFVVPGKLKDWIHEIATKTKGHVPFEPELVGKFYPHISTEELPSVSDLWVCWKKSKLKVCLDEFVKHLQKDDFSLHLYQLHKLKK